LITAIRKKKQNQQHKAYFHNHFSQIKINPKSKHQIYLTNLKKTQKIQDCSLTLIQIFSAKIKLMLKKTRKKSKKNQIMVDFLETVKNKKVLVVFLILVKLREVYLIITQVEIFLVIIKGQMVQTSLEINLPKTKSLLVYLVILTEDFLVIIKIKKLKRQVFFLLWVISRRNLILLEIFSEICFKIVAIVVIFSQEEITKIPCFYKAEEMITIKKKLILLTLIKNL